LGGVTLNHLKTRKRGKTKRVAGPACANATVHFTYLQTGYATAT